MILLQVDLMLFILFLQIIWNCCFVINKFCIRSNQLIRNTLCPCKVIHEIFELIFHCILDVMNIKVFIIYFDLCDN